MEPLHDLLSKLGGGCSRHYSIEQCDTVSLFGRDKYVQTHWRDTTCPDQYAKHCTFKFIYSLLFLDFKLHNLVRDDRSLTVLDKATYVLPIIETNLRLAIFICLLVVVLTISFDIIDIHILVE